MRVRGRRPHHRERQRLLRARGAPRGAAVETVLVFAEAGGCRSMSRRCARSRTARRRTAGRPTPDDAGGSSSSSSPKPRRAHRRQPGLPAARRHAAPEIAERRRTCSAIRSSTRQASRRSCAGAKQQGVDAVRRSSGLGDRAGRGRRRHRSAAVVPRRRGLARHGRPRRADARAAARSRMVREQFASPSTGPGVARMPSGCWSN